MIGFSIISSLALGFVLYSLYKRYSAQYFRKNMKPGDHCQVPYRDDWEIGVITEIRSNYVLVDLPDRVVKYSPNDLLPL